MLHTQYCGSFEGDYRHGVATVQQNFTLLFQHFVNGQPSAEFPNPVPAIPGEGNAARCRRPLTKR